MMIHVMCNTVFTATDVDFKIVTFLNEIYLKYQVIIKLLNQLISKSYQEVIR